MGITGNFWMRFIGRKPDGTLMKHAPGNYVHGQKYKIPFGHSKLPYWELLEKPPELKVEEETEALEEAYYIPEDEPTMTDSAPLDEITMTPTDADGHNFDPNASAILEPYMKFNPVTGLTSDIDPTEFLEPEPEVDETALLKEEILRLQKALKDAETTPSVKLETVVEEPEPVEEKLDRNELLGKLTEAGIMVKKGTRTTTLKKLVDDLAEN